MRPIICVETSVRNCLSTLCGISRDRRSLLHREGILKSLKAAGCLQKDLSFHQKIRGHIREYSLNVPYKVRGRAKRKIYNRDENSKHRSIVSKLTKVILMVWIVADRWQYDAGMQHDGAVVV